MGICVVKDCGKPVKAHGLCSAHYARKLLGKDFTKPINKQFHGLSVKERFEKWFIVDVESECWNWEGSLNNKGYGQFNYDGSKPIPAHRAAWFIYKGEIPVNESSAYKTHYVCHSCDNPKCVNPAHLFLGDQLSNMGDKMAKNRHRFGTSSGKKNGNTKLDEKDIPVIRASEESDSVLAKRYKISRASIYAIRHRQTWQHIE